MARKRAKPDLRRYEIDAKTIAALQRASVRTICKPRHLWTPEDLREFLRCSLCGGSVFKHDPGVLTGKGHCLRCGTVYLLGEFTISMDLGNDPEDEVREICRIRGVRYTQTNSTVESNAK